jgi:hypothetical protein
MKQETQITVVPIEIDPNLPEAKRKAIVEKFFPIYREIQDLSDDYAAITQSDVAVYTTSFAKKAGALRKKLVTLRGKNGLKGAHAELKEDVKLEGQVIDLMERKPRELLLEWEANLEQIEKYPEIEEARRIAELNADRLLTLETYILDKEDPALETLGELPEQKWEEVFLDYRNTWETEQEKLRLLALGEERLNTARTYELYIEDFTEIVFAYLTPKQFKKIISDATLAYTKQKEESAKAKEREELAAQKAAEEAKRVEAEAAQFRKRVSLITGGTLHEDGVYYLGKKIATIKSLETSDELKFMAFLVKHIETYDKDVFIEKQRLEAERQAEANRAAAQAKIEATAAAQRQVEENARKEAQEREDRLKEQREAVDRAIEAAQGAPDSEKLQELAKAFASVEVPEFKTEKGKEIEVRFKKLQKQWVSGLERIASDDESVKTN